MSRTIFTGNFDAEFFWRDDNSSKLPSISNCQGHRLVSAMQELQFVFCSNPSDLLITQYKMDSFHKHYLDTLGFQFVSNDRSIEFECQENEIKSIFNHLCKNTNSEITSASYNAFTVISPYAILPGYFDFCKINKISPVAANENIVKKVNSKIYSNRLSSELFGNKNGYVVCSSKELKDVGCKLLSENKQFLVKDEYGVSGNGNILINNYNFLNRIVKFLAYQEKKGRQTRFLLEGFLAKSIDFSCQFNISPLGDVQVLSIQQMENNDFSFSSIKSAEDDLLNFLERSDYYTQVEILGKQLYSDDYFGHICLDSMIEENGNIVPVVEINARKSMGLVNYYLDKYLSRANCKGQLGYYSLQIPKHLRFKDMFSKLKNEGILFTKDRPFGYIPLSANCFSINVDYLENESRYQGRFFYTMVAGDDEDKDELDLRLKKVFSEMGILCNK